MSENILEHIINRYDDVEFLKADGFDEAIIGVDTNSMRLIYSFSKCIDILCEKEKMSLGDAIEYLEFNVINAYVGDKTPIWCEDDFLN